MKQVTITKQQAQKVGMKSAFLNSKCTGRVAVTNTYAGIAKPKPVAITTRTSI